MSGPKIDLKQFTFDKEGIYYQCVFTDHKAGEIVQYMPVVFMAEGDKSYWTEDTNRPHAFIGRAKLNANGQVMPIQFAIPATCLQEAVDEFPNCIAKVVEQLHSQAIRNTLTQPVRNSQLDLSKLKS